MSQDRSPDPIATLQASAVHLHDLVTGLEPGQLLQPAYPSEWTIADALSHLGSAAVITRQRLEDCLTGAETDDGFNQSVWDEWNAKRPTDQAADSLAVDQALIDRMTGLTPEEAARVSFPFGPLTLDVPGMAKMRLNEHALHTWDVEVVVDPTAVLQQGTVPVVLENLGLLAGFAGRPTGEVRDITIRTTDPVRDFTLSLGADSVTLQPSESSATPDLELPAEALIRLVYGRLDPDHTPPLSGAVDIAELRKVFPGF